MTHKPDQVCGTLDPQIGWAYFLDWIIVKLPNNYYNI